MDRRIDGRHIAADVLDDLKKTVETEKIKPHLIVILVGNDPSSLSFIKQKQKAGAEIGAIVTLKQYPTETSDQELKDEIIRFNNDKNVDGIIIQRPLPNLSTIKQSTLHLVTPKKDIDGFVKNSPFVVPVAKGVITILEKIFYQHFNTPENDFVTWLRTQEIVVLGKGETAGRPIITILEKLSVPVILIDRSTPNPTQLLKRATVIISCVGRERIITDNDINKGVILISVGLIRGTDGKLHGDYEEEEIKDKALFYTPTPGGVGPVNVACLMHNLVNATQVDN